MSANPDTTAAMKQATATAAEVKLEAFNALPLIVLAGLR